MTRIFKYQLPIRDEFELELPKGAKVLSVINQYEQTCLYAEVDSGTTERDTYKFIGYGTGNECYHDDSYSFLGTVAFDGGSFIYHLFYKKL